MEAKIKKIVLLGAILGLSVVSAVAFSSSNLIQKSMTGAAEQEYSVSLGNISSAEASAASFTRQSSGGTNITFNTYGTVSALANCVMNMPYGNDSCVYNVTPITGMKSVTFQVANHLNVKLLYGSSLDSLEYATETFDDSLLNQDITVDFSNTVNVKYFKLIHFKGTGAQLKSFTVNYACAEKPIRGSTFNPDAGFTKDVDYSATDIITVDFKFTSASDTYLNIALLTDWSNGYGYFEIRANGTMGSYDGVHLYTLDDGYMRVVFDVAQLTKIQGGTPTTVGILFIRGSWTTGSGYVDVEPTSRALKTYAVEAQFANPTNYQCNISGSQIRANSGMIFTVSFDPEVSEKKSFTIAVMTDWSNWYGNFSVYNDGSASGGLKGFKIGEHTYQFFIDHLPSATTITGTPGDVAFIYLRGANMSVGGAITIAALL